MNKEYANYDYQSTTLPIKNDIGVTIGKETNTKFKLCTKDCKYKSNWKILKEWLIEQRKYDHGEDKYGDTLDKMNELEKENE